MQPPRRIQGTKRALYVSASHIGPLGVREAVEGALELELGLRELVYLDGIKRTMELIACSCVQRGLAGIRYVDLRESSGVGVGGGKMMGDARG